MLERSRTIGHNLCCGVNDDMDYLLAKHVNT